MSPQFVDFNADGHIDIVAGTFSGSPWIAFGTADGWRQPEMILDGDGQRIVLNQFWNYETKSWDKAQRCDPEGGAPAAGQLTSAWAMDWDDDGDLDLLLGDYHSGYVYLRMNEGSAKAPAFGLRNVVVHAGGKPVNVGKTATLRIIDWNGDGRDDLLVGSMGDPYGEQDGGGVHLFPGRASDDRASRFDAEVTLVANSPKGADRPVRPDVGLHMDVADHDGDGDLDLIVGGYSMWTPVMPETDEAGKARIVELRALLAKLSDRSRELNVELYGALEGIEDEAEVERIRDERLAKQGDERDSIQERIGPLRAELEKLAPGTKRKPFVWIYENLRVGGKVAGAR